MIDLLQCTLPEFISELRNKNIVRFFFAYDAQSKTVVASHKELQPIADFLLADERDFLKHEGLFCELSSAYNIVHGAFVHGTRRGQAAGGTRFWRYETFEDYVRDGLRLSQGMTRKNALAGLWWGGGKGVISRDPDIDINNPEIRKEIFQEYGRFVTSIQGCYITAEDVGTTPTDIDTIFSKTRFVTCISPQFGGSGNPSSATALGVFRGMEAAFFFKDGGNLAGRRIVMQGLGHVGEALLDLVLKSGVKSVHAFDINPTIVDGIKARYPDAALHAACLDPNDTSFLDLDCDLFSPCATGGVLNPETIPRLRASVVCGAANNQLEDAVRDDKLLASRGILYVPDFLVNRMGIVQCANEQYGHVDNDSFIERHLDKEWEQSVYQMTLKVLQRAKDTGEPPAHSAIQIADELALQEHPVFGHRGQEIISTLVRRGWQNL